MQQIQITALDWVILVLYFFAMAGIGIYVARKVRSTEHYFLGNRGFNKWLMMGQSFGVGSHAEMPVSLAGAVYNIGFSAIWFQWKNLFITPFYWIIAPIFRRYRRTTMAGMTGMKASLEPYKFSLAAPQGITVWFILMLTVNGLIGIMVQPHQLAAVGTGKNEKACRDGMAYGNFIKRFCTIGWAFVGLI